MTQYIAFLRAINVGGHVVRMERLRAAFTTLGFSDVVTVIASGNVLFRSAARNQRRLESTIERRLEAELGYQVATFIRSARELAETVACRPFPEADMSAAGASVFVLFLPAELDAAGRKMVASFASPVDRFKVHRRELFWLCRGRMLESEFSSARLEKMLGIRTTARNLTTVRRIAAISAEAGD